MNDKIAIKFNEKRVLRLPATIEGKFEYLIAGINYLDSGYWEEVKRHKSIQYKLNNNILEEVETTVKKIKVKETVELKNKETGKVENKTVEKEVETTITDFLKLSNLKKDKLIKETFNIKNLEELLAEETDSQIRLHLEKRIDEIKNAKTDETIDHPDTHLKVS